MIQIWKIDENNFFTGESYFVEEVKENHVTTPILVGYIKPFWTGLDWTEGATEEEIEQFKDKQIDICDEPTAEERITQLEADKEALAQNVYMLAEVLEALLGGEEEGQEESITEDTAS